MCCDNPQLLDMCADGKWGKYCTDCQTFTPED